MKKLKLILPILLISLPLFMFRAGAQTERLRYSMDFNWKFYQGDVENGQDPALDDSGWRMVDLPHDWSIEGEFDRDAPAGGRGGYLPGGTGWYRKSFKLPAEFSGKSIRLEFDGIYMNSDVWINGQHLGHRPYGYIGFAYDIGPYLKAGNNTLAVRVDNSLQPNSRWYSGSGIYRHTWLTVTGRINIPRHGICVTTPEVGAEHSIIDVKTTIRNQEETETVIMLRTLLLDPAGKTAGKLESVVSSEPGKTLEQSQEFDISAALFWSTETPRLYTLRSEILKKGAVIDRVETKFGIRRIEYSATDGFLLNGERVKLKGVCLHHAAGSVGAAVPEGVWERRLKLLRDMGCNAIRTSHNPMAPEFMDLCDRMGFLVMDEIFDEWKAGKVEHAYHNYFDEWSQADLVEFIHRDRNHPSVVMWSAGNEIGEQSREGGEEVLRSLIETFHREDPTRPVTTGNDHIAADGRTATPAFLNMLDIVGYNYVDRWHARRELYFTPDRIAHPEWKQVGTESVSNSSIRGMYYIGEDPDRVQPAYNSGMIRAEQLWKYEAVHDFVIGDFMWTGIDYLGEARWPAKNASSGVLDLCGFEKDGYYFYQSQWTENPVLHVFPHWNWKGREGQVFPVLVYTNCDTVELYLNGKYLGAKSYEFPRQGTSGGWNRYERPYLRTTTADLHLSWDVAYEPGVLKAVGIRDGKQVLLEEIHTTSEPYAVRLTAGKDEINADARDVVHVRVEVVDREGRLVPTANNRIRFSLEGNGKLLGVDNGNPWDHDSFKLDERDAFGGLALAIVQSTRQSGKFTLKASTEGLKADEITVSCVKTKIEPYIK